MPDDQKVGTRKVVVPHEHFLDRLPCVTRNERVIAVERDREEQTSVIGAASSVRFIKIQIYLMNIH